VKKTIAAIAITLALAGSAFAQDQPQPARGTNDAPVIAGIYYQSPTGYVRMELLAQSGFKTSGGWKVAMTYGAASIHGKWLYRGPSALTQLSDRRPVFVLVSPMENSTQSIALIPLAVKKDHREADSIKANAWGGVSEGNSTVALTVTRTPNSNNLTIVPQADLNPGEYLLVTGLMNNGVTGYDFGVK
jgi:hypothetical protein